MSNSTPAVTATPATGQHQAPEDKDWPQPVAYYMVTGTDPHAWYVRERCEAEPDAQRYAEWFRVQSCTDVEIQPATSEDEWQLHTMAILCTVADSPRDLSGHDWAITGKPFTGLVTALRKVVAAAPALTATEVLGYAIRDSATEEFTPAVLTDTLTLLLQQFGAFGPPIYGGYSVNTSDGIHFVGVHRSLSDYSGRRLRCDSCEATGEAVGDITEDTIQQWHDEIEQHPEPDPGAGRRAAVEVVIASATITWSATTLKIARHYAHGLATGQLQPLTDRDQWPLITQTMGDVGEDHDGWLQDPWEWYLGVGLIHALAHGDFISPRSQELHDASWKPDAVSVRWASLPVGCLEETGLTLKEFASEFQGNVPEAARAFLKACQRISSTPIVIPTEIRLDIQTLVDTRRDDECGNYREDGPFDRQCHNLNVLDRLQRHLDNQDR
ncbi:hypothetical protein D5S17_35610 [Pseudonocardiaceae bacterium YIM PH 21723]|nr:hypothetical protein D5S17_35610 [Pseudonocardiaceae bacterium YIM PH 21723]